MLATLAQPRPLPLLNRLALCRSVFLFCRWMVCACLGSDILSWQCLLYLFDYLLRRYYVFIVLCVFSTRVFIYLCKLTFVFCSLCFVCVFDWCCVRPLSGYSFSLSTTVVALLCCSPVFLCETPARFILTLPGVLLSYPPVFLYLSDVVFVALPYDVSRVLVRVLPFYAAGSAITNALRVHSALVLFFVWFIFLHIPPWSADSAVTAAVCCSRRACSTEFWTASGLLVALFVLAGPCRQPLSLCHISHIFGSFLLPAWAISTTVVLPDAEVTASPPPAQRRRLFSYYYCYYFHSSCVGQSWSQLSLCSLQRLYSLSFRLVVLFCFFVVAVIFHVFLLLPRPPRPTLSALLHYASRFSFVLVCLLSRFY